MILLAYLIAAIVRVHAWLTTHPTNPHWTTADQRAFQRECANTGGPR